MHPTWKTLSNIGTVTASPEYYTCTLVWLLCAYCIIWLHVKDTETDDSSSDDTNILILSDIWYQFLTDLFNLTAYLSEFNTVNRSFTKFPEIRHDRNHTLCPSSFLELKKKSMIIGWKVCNDLFFYIYKCNKWCVHKLH